MVVRPTSVRKVIGLIPVGRTRNFVLVAFVHILYIYRSQNIRYIQGVWLFWKMQMLQLDDLIASQFKIRLHNKFARSYQICNHNRKLK